MWYILMLEMTRQGGETDGCSVTVYYGFYAEDRCEADEDPDLPLALVAARLDDIAASGPLGLDEQSAECPIETRLGRGFDEIWGALERSERDWKASYDILGSFVCLGSVDPDKLRVIGGLDDLAALVAEVADIPAPAGP